jgi:hypothetical protein
VVAGFGPAGASVANRMSKEQGGRSARRRMHVQTRGRWAVEWPAPPCRVGAGHLETHPLAYLRLRTATAIRAAASRPTATRTLSLVGEGTEPEIPGDVN